MLRQPPRNLEPRYNIAPTAMIDVVRVHDSARELVPMRWGPIPAWWKKTIKELPATFNARAESVSLSGQSGRGLSGQLY
jgi:putative SOS response-associated peptidase YedK